jgi:hypothetical protein
MSKKESE